MRKTTAPLFSFLLFAWNPGITFASHPEHWVSSGVEDFLKGDLKGVSLTNDGRLMLAPSAEVLLDTKEAFVHAMVANPANTLFLGTSVGGKVFRIPSGGSGAEFAKLDEPGVYALALDPQNRLYAGTSPNGKVYRLSQEGKPEVFFDPDDKFIWDLAFDDKGNLYVATGPQGVIYKVTPAGQSSSFFDSEETHIVRLGWDLNRNLLAGSSPGGLLYRMDPSGKPFVLLDSALEEVKGIAVDRYGVIYAAALSGGTTAKSQSESTSASTAKAAGDDSDTVESTVQAASGAPGGRMEIYRVDKDGLVETVLSSDSQVSYDLLARNDGSLLLATGNKGRIMAIDRRGFVQLLVDTVEEQVTAMREVAGGLVFVTANLGKVYRVSTDAATSGAYESDVLDAGMSSRWGRIRWRVLEPSSAQTVKLFTRSGNTRKPDRTWSGWSDPYSDSSGTQVASAPGRYLQWKAEFAAEARPGAMLSQSDALDWVSISYQQANAAPVLTSLSALAPGVGLARMPGNPTGGVQPGGPDGGYAPSMPKAIRDLETPKISAPSRKIYLPGVRSFTWKAADPNDDSLLYTVYIKREGQNVWLTVEKDISETEVTVDGANLPDGSYTLRVVASDRLSNPAGQELTDELISKPFVISKQLPTAVWGTAEVNGTSATIGFEVKTGTSPLYQVDYALDDGEWRVVYPEDGVADSVQEKYVIKLEGLRQGAHQIRVRMIDTAGNVSASAKQF